MACDNFGGNMRIAVVLASYGAGDRVEAVAASAMHDDDDAAADADDVVVGDKATDQTCNDVLLLHVACD